MNEAQSPFLELLRRKREELVARQAAVMQEAQVAQQQVIALGGAIAGVDEMVAEIAAGDGAGDAPVVATKDSA